MIVPTGGQTKRVVVTILNRLTSGGAVGWGGVLTSFVVRTSNYVSIPCKTSSKYVVIISINFQLRYHPL